MAQICGKCKHVNPPDAAYCYYDGAVLGGHSANGGPLNTGAQPFPSQFVFPSGQMCGNFDQLATACQQRWAEAVDLLKQGFLASFLGGLGRADLAMAAQDAARFPDQDRGLDQLLAKLPTHVVQPPKLKVEPAEVNLGVVPMGADRPSEIHLSNQGMRLLYGSVVSDSKWLTLGDTPGNAQKLFQFGDESVIPVHIRGQHLRAGTKPLEGQLLIESNGGTATVTVRVEVPVKPFAEGVLAGATTPRQIAEKAKAAPKEAAALFEKGAVAKWFTDNGWIYPVQGPSASGLGAVQQFFEALGLASAPKVEISEQVINFQGAVGQSLKHLLEVKTQEKRPVYAHATCDQPWLDVSRTQLNGRIATIPVVVPSVPNRPGETLQAAVHVTSNGNQRFHVPVTLTIAGASPFAFSSPAAPGFSAAGEPAAATMAADSGDPFGSFALGAAPAAAPSPAATEAAAPRVRREQTSVWVHLAPAGLLVLALLAVIGKDLLFTGGGDVGVPIDKSPRIKVLFDYGKGKDIGTSMRFGLVMMDPNNLGLASAKRLTFNDRGQTNSTVLKIDNAERIFGHMSGKWLEAPVKIDDMGGKKATWVHDEGIQVTQTVEIVPGEPQVEKGAYKRLLDTCLVRYTIENKSSQPHKVGLRIVLDTLIGVNDGVPFTVPGMQDLVESSMDFKAPQPVPDFIQALETSDLKNPGIVAQLNLKLGGKLEPPGRVSLTRWPGHKSLEKWEVPIEPMGNDSAVVLYWDEKDLKPGETRELGFSYGLGSVATGTGGELGVTIGGSFLQGSELTVVGLVTAPQKDQTLTLVLPKEGDFSFVDNMQATQPVPAPQAGVAGRPTPVTWRIRAGSTGTFPLSVQSSTGVSLERQVTIKSKPLF